MCWIPFYSSILFFVLFFKQVHGFAVITSQPRQCGGQRFNWVGGTPPFTALIIVPFGVIRNVSIPAHSWNERDQSGDFSYPLELNQSQKVVFSMGDATGPTAGGVTDVATVGAPAEGSQPCNTTSASPDFTFETDLPLLQCKNFSFGQLGTAVQPISVLVTVPHGESFTLTAPLGDPFFWRANLTAGTSVIFTMKDAQNRVGGTSQVLNVGISDDSSCLGPPPVSAPPTRLPKLPTTSSSNPSRTHMPNTTNTSSSGNDSRSKDNKTDNKTGVIVGSSVGGTVGLLVIIALIFCLTKRKGRHNGVKRIDLTGSAPGVSTSFLSPGQIPYHDRVAPTPYFVNPNGVAPLSGSSTLTSVGSCLDTGSSSTAAAVAAIVGAETLAGTMDTKANHSVMSFKQEAIHQREGHQRHLYFDPYTRNWQQQDYGFDPYTDASSSSRKLGSMSGSGVGTASNTGISTRYNEATSPRTRKSPLISSFTTHPPRHLVMHTDMEDEVIELPPMYSDSRTCIPG